MSDDQEPAEDNTRPDKPADVMDGTCECGKPFATRQHFWHDKHGRWMLGKERATCSPACRQRARRTNASTPPGAETNASSRKTNASTTPGEVQYTDMVFTVKITRRTVCGMTPDEVADDMTKVVRGMLSSLNRIEADVTEVTGRRVSARWVNAIRG